MVKVVQKEEKAIHITTIMLLVSVYIACPLWVGLATNSIKWGVAAFIFISFWLADALEFPKKKKPVTNQEKE